MFSNLFISWFSSELQDRQKMKFIGYVLLALVAGIAAAPLGPGLISNSIVGDIISVGIGASAHVSSSVDQRFVNVFSDFSHLPESAFALGQAEDPIALEAQELNISLEMIEQFKSSLLEYN